MDLATLIGNFMHQELDDVRVRTNLNGVYWMTKEKESIESELVEANFKNIELKTREDLLNSLCECLTELFLEDMMYMMISSTVEKSEYLGVMEDLDHILNMLVSSFCELKLKINNWFYGAFTGETGLKVWLCLGENGRCQTDHRHVNDPVISDEDLLDRQSTLRAEFFDIHEIAQYIYHGIFSRARDALGHEAAVTLLESLSDYLPENVDMGDFLKYIVEERSQSARVSCVNPSTAESLDDMITVDGDMVFMKCKKSEMRRPNICGDCLLADCGEDVSPRSSTIIFKPQKIEDSNSQRNITTESSSTLNCFKYHKELKLPNSSSSI